MESDSILDLMVSKESSGIVRTILDDFAVCFGCLG
jgi:hypothetical protein